MSESDANLVIQISTITTALDATVCSSPGTEQSMLGLELKEKLQPGSEVTLTYHGYLALASILWVADSPAGPGVRVGVRLLAVSAAPDLQLPGIVKSDAEREMPHA